MTSGRGKPTGHNSRPPHTLPSTGASQTLGLQLPWASSWPQSSPSFPCLPNPATTQATFALDFCKLLCLVQDLTAISPPIEAASPSLDTQGGGKPRGQGLPQDLTSLPDLRAPLVWPWRHGLAAPHTHHSPGISVSIPSTSQPRGNAGLAFTGHFQN